MSLEKTCLQCQRPVQSSVFSLCNCRSTVLCNNLKQLVGTVVSWKTEVQQLKISLEESQSRLTTTLDTVQSALTSVRHPIHRGQAEGNPKADVAIMDENKEHQPPHAQSEDCPEQQIIGVQQDDCQQQDGDCQTQDSDQ
ncbi:unnamed protein product [Calypogeia fissa]